MKRKVSKVLSVLLIAALMLSFTAVASAETRMYATSAVNVRSGPGTSYYIIGSLEQNEMVTATGRAYNGWYEIAWGSYGYGYVAGNYLSYSKYEPGYNPNYNCYPSRRGVTLKVCQDCGDIYYATTALNVRQGPSTKYSIVGSLNRGQQCTAIGKSGNWYKLLTADGSTAYASAKYLKLYARQNGSTPSTPSTPSYPSGNYGTYYATTGLNVRQGPGTNYRVVYTLDRGESVTFTGQTYGKWISVKTRTGVQGYCSSLYLTQKGSYNPGGSTGARYYCGRCGKAITYGNAYCSNCGARIDYSGSGCYNPCYDVSVGYTYATNYKTPLYASASASSAEIASLDSGVRVVVSSVTMNGSWAQVYVPYLQAYGYLPVDAIK
ncbi:MAG: SH3 domain-containing protein [Eubacteriales bacterium]|nr:SH3 domain-containing protein [Eubacteriales bacterium]